MGDKEHSKGRDADGAIPKAKREELIEAAAKQAAAAARTRMSAILVEKEVGRRTLRREDVRVDVSLPSLAGMGSVAFDGPAIQDKDPAGTDGTWIIDSNPTDTVVYTPPGGGDVWYADMTDSTDPV